MDQRSARALLDTDRRRAAARLDAAAEELRDIVAATEHANGDDEHDPEGATVAFERARVAALVADAEAALEAVDRALDRMAAGTFGRCTGCGNAITEERLRARPTAERCIACAAAGGRRAGPVNR